MLSSTSSFVHRRGSVFWFRKAVPAGLTDRLGRSDIRRSLRTSNKRVARQRSWTLILVIEDAFAVLRDAELTPCVRGAFDAILGRVMNDFDPDQRAWAERAKYRLLIESLSKPGNDNVTVERPAALVSAPMQAGLPGQVNAHAGRVHIPANAILSGTNDFSDLLARALRDAQIDPRARKPLGSSTIYNPPTASGGRSGLTAVLSYLDVVPPRGYPPFICRQRWLVLSSIR